jgi:hypothetical protein
VLARLKRQLARHLLPRLRAAGVVPQGPDGSTGFTAISGIIRDLPLDIPLHRWLRHFDLHFYRSHGHCDGTADLAHLDERALVHHFVHQGWREGRSYNRFFHSFIDPTFYCARYPELGFDPGRPGEAIRHWMYYGVYEGRIPNRTTQTMVDADLYLFQMGKVGSKSIESAIRRATGSTALIPHFHWANQLINTYPDCFFDLGQIIDQPRKAKRLVIAGVREPISRVLSGQFQAVGEAESSRRSEDMLALLGRSPEEAVHAIAGDVELITGWFDHRFFCGLDVYATPFDAAAGHAVLENDKLRVFVYRQDRLRECWPALSEFVGHELPWTETNRTADKAVNGDYRRIADTVRLPAGYLEQVFDSRYARHFFTEPERRQLIQRWAAP